LEETKVKSTVEFKNVCFTYPNADEAVLKNISFKASPNETVAIIGSTGSGKSTIVNLIPRFKFAGYCNRHSCNDV
jgi:ATP-binding cassette subfamily B multidrug efflux pump